MRDVYELYIDDLLCDLSSDESVSLVYQSGLFSELDSIQSNRSHTIDLPATARNLGIVGMANRPDVASDAPYNKHRASLYQGGIALFIDGFAVITEITDEAISIVLTWGNVENFEPLFDANLRDLGEVLKSMPRGNWDCAHIDWNENSVVPVPQTTPLQKVAFYGVDFGMGISTPQYVHPSVTVAAVVEAIEKYHGITIDGKNRLSPDLILPCVSKNADEVSNEAEPAITRPAIVNTDNISEPAYWLVGNWNNMWGGATLVERDNRNIFGLQQVNTLGAKSFKINIYNASVSNSVGFPAFAISGLEFYGDMSNQVGLEIINNNGEVLAYFPAVKTANIGTFSYIFNEINVKLDVSKSEYIKFHFKGITYLQKYGQQGSLGIRMATLTITSDWKDVVYPSVYPIAPNLPDMSHGDFIATLLTLNGLFAYIDNAAPNTIKLMSADDIYDNLQKGASVDWSNRVLVNARRRPDMPDSSQYAIEDYAQHNSLDYDNDDEVKADTVGYIDIQNRTLDKEAELVKLDFSASDNITLSNGMTVARIEAYEQEDNNSSDEIKAKYSEPTPRILSVDYDQFYFCYGQFTSEQYFGGKSGIVATKYASLQKILDRFRLVTVRMRLTALDLYNLDYRKPVFLSQFGQYFAIYKIETQANGICDCQLIQLKTIQ